MSIAIAAVELAATFTLTGDTEFFSPAGTYGTSVLFGSLTAWVLLVTITLTLHHQHLEARAKHDPPVQPESP